MGRAINCDVTITEKVVKKIQFISTNHFRLYRNIDEGLNYLEDLSLNGTFVNNKKVGKKQRVVLQNNDQISLAFPSLKGM